MKATGIAVLPPGTQGGSKLKAVEQALSEGTFCGLVCECVCFLKWLCVCVCAAQYKIYDRVCLCACGGGRFVPRR
ncbi:hypothetical protein T492DRAFT_944477 [Pavlovales sp. CCMP2436]|nr:hypothetical protein T492DRAFT_944477 [Pavlovales sp. CCMP2436]